MPLNQVRSAERLRDFLAEPAVRSNFATRSSRSSISVALVPCSRTSSAARSWVPAGVFGSSMIFKMVVTAAPAASCSRPVAWENVVRRDSRQAASNSGSFIQRSERVGADSHRAGRLLDASVREQRGNRLLHLLIEFCSVSYHLPPSAPIWRQNSPFLEPMLIPNRIRLQLAGTQSD